MEGTTKTTTRYRGLETIDDVIYCTPATTCIQQIEENNVIVSEYGSYAPAKQYSD
jgi:predicted Rossmann fold nucleotide-binding protein DprA/Smf involved in DNA uptake